MKKFFTLVWFRLFFEMTFPLKRRSMINRCTRAAASGTCGPLLGYGYLVQEMLVDKIMIYRHSHVLDAAGNRHYTIRAIPDHFPKIS